MVLDASATRCVASATSEVASELQPDERAYQELGELSYSLSGMQKDMCNRKKNNLEVVVKSVSCVGSYMEMTSLSNVIQYSWRR